MKMYDGFAEDTWKVSPKFTVTAGVRYDVQLTPPPGMINTQLPASFHLLQQTIKNVTDRVQPRVGFSMVALPSGDTVRARRLRLVFGVEPGQHLLCDARRERRCPDQLQLHRLQEQRRARRAGRPAPPSRTRPALSQYPNVPFMPTGPSLDRSASSQLAAQPPR